MIMDHERANLISLDQDGEIVHVATDRRWEAASERLLKRSNNPHLRHAWPRLVAAHEMALRLEALYALPRLRRDAARTREWAEARGGRHGIDTAPALAAIESWIDRAIDLGLDPHGCAAGRAIEATGPRTPEGALVRRLLEDYRQYLCLLRPRERSADRVLDRAAWEIEVAACLALGA
jgi:hypothetical protein